jgi:hypothetical protein
MLGIFLGIINIDLVMPLSVIIFILAAIFTLLSFKEIKAGTIASKIRIDENGLTLTNNKKKIHMAWQHIVWAGYYINGYIVFSCKADEYILKQRLQFERMSDNLIFFQLQPGVLTEIKKYWAGEIITKPTHTRIKWFT